MKKTTKKILAGITTLAVMTSVMVCSFVSCDKNNSEDYTHVLGGLIVEEKETQGISLCTTTIFEEDYTKYNLPEGTLEAKLVTYEILPEDSTYKKVEYSLVWSLDSVYDPSSDWHSFHEAERWAEVATISDYIDVISVENGFVISLLDKTFSFPVNMTIKVVGTDIESTLQIAYELRLSEAADFSWFFGGRSQGSLNIVSSKYDPGYDEVYGLNYLFLEEVEVLQKETFDLGVYGGSIWDEKLNIERDPYSKLGDYDSRVSFSKEWLDHLNYGEGVYQNSFGLAGDYYGLRLENYEFRSLASLIVAPSVEKELWPTIFSMTTEELLLEYNEVFRFFVDLIEDVSDGSHFPVFIVSLYDNNEKQYYASYVTFDAQSIGEML